MGDADLLVPASALANDRAWAIVRRLAESEAVFAAGFPGSRAVFQMCRYCFAEDYGDGVQHRETCLWRNAKEVLDAQA